MRVGIENDQPGYQWQTKCCPKGSGVREIRGRQAAFRAPFERRGMLLRIEDAYRSFAALHAVEGVSFDVDAGQIVALIGPNGASKTTLLDMISGHRALERAG